MLTWIVAGVAVTYIVSWIWLFGFGLNEQPAPAVSQMARIDRPIQWFHEFSNDRTEVSRRVEDDRRVPTPVWLSKNLQTTWVANRNKSVSWRLLSDFGTFEIGHAHILATTFIIHLPILPLSSNIVIWSDLQVTVRPQSHPVPHHIHSLHDIELSSFEISVCIPCRGHLLSLKN